ncbi:MAG TPA: metallophosphoesterase family protein [Trueperaceae bacterium]
MLSDVHADPRSLELVLAHAGAEGWDEAIFLGDAVGYGEDAAGAVALLRSLPLRAGIKGNHEEMLDELRAGRRPNAARPVVATLSRNLAQLAPDDLSYLDGLRERHLDESWGAVHGALRRRFEYLISVPLARSNASHMKRDLYFVGHTHVPAAYIQEPGAGWSLRPFGPNGGRIRLAEGARAFLNPGSVSVPRDGVAGASYAIFDEGEREFRVGRAPLAPPARSSH